MCKAQICALEWGCGHSISAILQKACILEMCISRFSVFVCNYNYFYILSPKPFSPRREGSGLEEEGVHQPDEGLSPSPDDGLSALMQLDNAETKSTSPITCVRVLKASALPKS